MEAIVLSALSWAFPWQPIAATRRAETIDDANMRE
jgi:hypothetical protein